MKKSKLLILFPVMGLFLSGCTFQEGLQSTKSWISSHIYHPLKDFFSGSSTPSEEGKKDEGGKEQPKDEGKTFSFADWEKYFADEGYTGVKIPDYKCASSSATMSVYDEDYYPNYMLIKGSNATEMGTFVGSFSSDWEKYESSGQYYFAFGGFPEPGQSAPLVSIADYSSDADVGGIIVAFDIYEEPEVVASFPLEKVNEFLTANSFGFTFSEADATALSALSTEFSFYSEEGYAHVEFKGEIESEVLAAVDATLVAAEFTYYEGYGYYDESFAYAVGTDVDEGYTYLIFMIAGE